jgi:tetratricopeptide (TPR) repeat protein
MARQRIWIVLISIIATNFSGCEQKKRDKCSLFYANYKAIKSSDTSYLLSVLNRVIAQENTCIDALLTRGDIFFEIDSLESAKNDYLKVLLFDSLNVYSMYQLGLLFHVQKKYDSAIDFFQKALKTKSTGKYTFDHTNDKLDPAAKYDIETNELLFSIGLSFYYNRQLNLALKNFDHLIQQKYKLDKTYLYRGAILIEQGSKNGNACSDLNEAKMNGNEDAEAYLSKYCR